LQGLREEAVSKAAVQESKPRLKLKLLKKVLLAVSKAGFPGK
jgi:hypothetical protein